MPSESAVFLKEKADIVAKELYRIAVTDAWFYHHGGNVQLASQGTQMHSMIPVLAAIRGVGGLAPSALGGRHIVQTRVSWILQGNRTLITGRGVCTDCAAAAAVKFIEEMDKSPYEALVEIISTASHTFVVVNRAGDVRSPEQWGGDAFIIDVWLQNQFEPNFVAGAVWANDWRKSVSHFIHDNASFLKVEATLRQVTGSLVD